MIYLADTTSGDKNNSTQHSIGKSGANVSNSAFVRFWAFVSADGIKIGSCNKPQHFYIYLTSVTGGRFPNSPPSPILFRYRQA
jgi:hypothetical protein